MDEEKLMEIFLESSEMPKLGLKVDYEALEQHDVGILFTMVGLLETIKQRIIYIIDDKENEAVDEDEKTEIENEIDRLLGGVDEN